MNTNDSHIVGSAEPLSPEQTEERLRELEAWGVDPSLIRMALSLSPTERIDWMLGVHAFANSMRKAMEEQRFYTLPVLAHTAVEAGIRE